MYLKSLVGRAAGSVVDMQKVAAEAALVNGTHVVATEEEIMAAGYTREPVQSDVAPATLPEGFKVVRYPGGGGFELRHSDDTPAADKLFPNMLAAYEHARGLLPPDDTTEDAKAPEKEAGNAGAEQPTPSVPEPEPVVTPAPESLAPAPSAPGGKRRG